MCKDVIKSSALLYISSQFNDDIAEFRRISRLNAKKNLNHESESETTNQKLIINGINTSKTKVEDLKESLRDVLFFKF